MRLTFDRYTVMEFIPPFLASVAGLTVMLLSGILYELSDLIFDNRMPVSVAGKLLIYKLPEVIVLTIPIGVLFATLLSLGRLTKDSELTAMRAVGIPFRRLIIPVLAVGVVISGISFLMHEKVVPEANHRAENLYRESLLRDTMPGIRQDVFFQGPGGRHFYVGQVNQRDNTLERVFIYEPEPDGFPDMITAQRGRFSDGVWYLEDGVTRHLDAQGFTEHEVRWDALEYQTPEGAAALFGTQKTPSEMTRQELGEHIRLFSRSGIDVRRFEVEYHLRLATPFASFLWVLIGAPLSLKSPRSGRFFGIVIAIVIVFVYYVSTAIFRSLGGNGVLSPASAAWATNGLFALIGLVLLARSDRN